MISLSVALLIAAFVCFVVASYTANSKVGYAGLACWVLSNLVGIIIR